MLHYCETCGQRMAKGERRSCTVTWGYDHPCKPRPYRRATAAAIRSAHAQIVNMDSTQMVPPLADLIATGRITAEEAVEIRRTDRIVGERAIAWLAWHAAMIAGAE